MMVAERPPARPSPPFPPPERFPMPDVTVVAEQFRKLHCSHCQAPFTPEAVTPLRQEADYWVVRVVCTACNHPSGVAVVGTEPGGEAPLPPPPAKVTELRKAANAFANRREEKRFAGLGPITADEVLDACRKIQALGGDWARFLPRR